MHKKSFQTQLNSLLLALERVIQKKDDISFLDKFPSDKELDQITIKIELLGEAIEENINYLDFNDLERIEKIFHEMVLILRFKLVGDIKKEEYRRRMRYSSGFILTLIYNIRIENEKEEEEMRNDFLKIACFDD